MNNIKSDHLVSAGSILIGAGTIMNIAGIYFQYNYSNSDEEADRCAIFRDWRMVGQDIEKAIETEGPSLLAQGVGG
ncbi:MAG: hypothetical protein LV481_01575 [Methylacidiphilales bacterium]|nr:hypothetical protein [Candidatus Methylacidiphilales bacterium]